LALHPKRRGGLDGRNGSPARCVDSDYVHPPADTYPWRRYGETSSCSGSAEAVVKSWMNSTEGHRETMLDCRLREAGVGYDYDPATGEYTTMVYATPTGSERHSWLVLTKTGRDRPVVARLERVGTLRCSWPYRNLDRRTRGN
jgi:hypothetical protein